MGYADIYTEIPRDKIVPKPPFPRFIDMEGKKYNRLTAVAYAGLRRPGTNSRWWFLCDCGNYIRCEGSDVRKGNTRSCGCLASEVHSAQWTTHGWSTHPMWTTYQYMVSRCTKPGDKNYGDYGGRGIRVHPAWLEDASLYYEHVESLPYYREPGRSLDRIDNDGDYAPGNLRWATQSEQMKNSRHARWLTRSDGECHTVSDWCRILGLKLPSGIHNRLNANWPLEHILWTKKGEKRHGAPGSEE